MAIESFDVPGLVLSAYFAGFTLGALRCSRIIERIGHIRAYAAFAGLVAAAVAMIVVKTMQEITRRIRQAGRTMQLDVMQGAWVSDMLLDAYSSGYLLTEVTLLDHPLAA